MSLELTSNAFSEGKTIPKKYSCDGEDLSPPLSWSGAPNGTERFALIADDPDAPGMTFVHWVIYNIPGSATSLSEGIESKDDFPDGTMQGANNFRKIGYGGPCPPGGTHRYYFKLYALNAELSLKPGATKDELLAAMENHIIEETQLMGTYTR
jgi:hypothetical protein